MNNILTICEELLTQHGDEEFEVSELADSPIMAVTVRGGNLEVNTTLPENQKEYVVKSHKFDTLLPLMNIDFTIMGYVERGKFYLFSVIVDGEGDEMSPSRRCHFIELFNTNKDGVFMQHVPVAPTILGLKGATRALKNGSKMEDVVKYTTREIIELCSGISPMTKRPRKGLVFKSLTTNYRFKALSEATMMMGSL